MSSGVFPSHFKAAFITPLLKKPNLDPFDGKSYRPISNLSVLTKLLQRLVARQLIDRLNAWKLMPTLQSAYRANHSTETAVLRVVSDILDALDRGDLAALTSLDLSAAFDTVDHKTLIRSLDRDFLRRSLHCSTVDRFSTSRTTYATLRNVQCRGHSSNPSVVLCGVRQGGHVHEDSRVADWIQLFCCSATDVRCSVSQPVLLYLVTSLVLSRLDYGSVNLIGISRRLQDRLQSVLNAASRLVCNGRKYDDITPLLRDLHWLRIAERIAFRLVVLVFRCRNSTAPEYTWRETCSGQSTMTHVSDSDLRRVTNWSSGVPD